MIEKIELTNMCMICDENMNVVVEHRIKSWCGWAFPGGHVEPHEGIVDSVIREIKEETNLDISDLKLVGIKQWEREDVRHIVFLYKTNKYSGVLKSSDEGEVKWVPLKELFDIVLWHTFKEMIDLMTDDEKSELILRRDSNNELYMVFK